MLTMVSELSIRFPFDTGLVYNEIFYRRGLAGKGYQI